MDYVLLSPEEAAALLDLGAEEIVGLIESGELGGLKVAGNWKVPLKSITQILAVGTQPRSARSLEQVFADPAAWQRVFGAHPEVQQFVAGEFPAGSVGAYLKEAITNSQAQREAAGSGKPDPGRQDEEYGEGEAGDERSA